MHDDQHGTAIISSAALLNALEITEKKIEKIKIVVSGAGAAAMACTDLYIRLGAKLENIIMCDSKGVIRRDRENLDALKEKYATDRDCHTLTDAMKDSDVFLGLSVADTVTPDMLKSMSNNPIVFALANPNPEIAYDLATKTREDIIMATGRSDHPNQVNNVLGFPYIFRGAIDVRATEINEEMKLAAVRAIAELAKEPVPEMVLRGYHEKQLSFGNHYLIPKPIDPRLITAISPAVAKAAIDSGVAKHKISNWEEYSNELEERIGIDHRLMSRFITKARKDPKRIIFVDANHLNILKAAQRTLDSAIGTPILMGRKDEIFEMIEKYEFEALKSCDIVDPADWPEKVEEFAKYYFEKRQRKGINMQLARKAMLSRTYFGMMMVERGEADVLLSGISNYYPKTLLPALEIIGVEEGVNRIAGMYVVNTEKRTYFFADSTVNLNPTAEEMAEIIGLVSREVRFFGTTPVVAVLSYSNFGSAKGEVATKTAKAVALAKEKYPDLIIDGEFQANVALNKTLRQEMYPFSTLGDKQVNTLIFPDLQSGNIAYKMMMEIGGAEVIGPLLMGVKKPVQVLQSGSTAREIFNLAALAVTSAQEQQKK